MKNKEVIIIKLKKLLYVMDSDVQYHTGVAARYCPVGYDGMWVDKKYIEYWIEKVENDFYDENEEIEYILSKCNEVWLMAKRYRRYNNVNAHKI